MNEELIEIFLEKGYIEVVGYNPVGDPVYKITKKFYEEQKELLADMKKMDSDILNSIWFKGYIDLKMDEEFMEDFDLALEYEAGDRRDWESLQRRKAEAEKVCTEAVPYIQ